MSSLYYSGDTGTNRGTSLRHPWDTHRRAQIRSDVLCQAAEDLAAEEQAQVEQYDPLNRNSCALQSSCPTSSTTLRRWHQKNEPPLRGNVDSDVFLHRES
jgi:hypothetical protein